mgnify:CR=1 FL=1
MNLRNYGLIIYWHLICLTVVYLWPDVSTCAQPLLEHNLTVTLKPDEHRLIAVDRVALDHPDLENLTFLMAEHLKVSSVTAAGSKLKHRFDGGLLQVELPDLQDRLVLRIEYKGIFNDNAPVLPLNTDNPGFGVTGAITPKGTLLLDGAKWYPVSRNGTNKYLLTVIAPIKTMAVTTGQLLGHSTKEDRSVSRWSLEDLSSGMPLVAGPYIRTTRSFGKVTAATYFSPPLQPLSKDYLAAIGRYLKFYADLFGPYPFGQFAVVENFFPTGYGFPGFTLMGRQVLRLPFIIHTSLGHEIAHCWWGNGVLVDLSQGNWSEGLTTYVADYLYKEKQDQGQEQRLGWLRNYAGLINPGNDFPLSRFSGRSDPVTKTIGYDKGAMVFHMLRQTVGDEAFWNALREVYNHFCFKAITWSDFQTIFEKQSNRNLDWFFDQWVFRTGAPEFRLADVKMAQNAHGYRISGNIRQTAPFYRFSVEMLLSTAGLEQRQNVTVSGAKTAFEFTSSEKPQALKIDPRVHLFRKLEPDEIPASINTLKGAPSISILVARKLGKSYLDIARRLAVSLGLDSAWIGFDDTFPADTLDQTDIICIGSPGDKRFLPSVGNDFSLESRTYTLMGKTYDLETNSFFGVFKNPGKMARTLALFLPASHEAAVTISGKLTHYGKYSYLVFDGARNAAKGIWPVTSSALTRKWAIATER